nr:uncharacterized protein LOC119161897 [Rhipicephalus microplus]
MGYVKTPSVSSISWGVSIEPKAKEAFVSDERKKHQGFHLMECGLFVMKTLPILATSPDEFTSSNFPLKCVKLKRTPKSWTCSKCQVARGPD